MRDSWFVNAFPNYKYLTRKTFLVVRFRHEKPTRTTILSTFFKIFYFR